MSVRKLPYLPLFTGDWKKDPALSLCSPSTRGVWIDFLCAMHDQDRSGRLSGTPTQLAILARCTPVEVAQAIDDLRIHRAADVTERDGIITVVNRRMARDEKTRNSGKERQSRHRLRRKTCESNGGVTSTSVSVSVSSQTKGETPLETPCVSRSENRFDAASKAVKENIPEPLRVERFWVAWCEWAKHRREIKKPLKETQVEKQLASMAKIGVDAAIRRIEYTIEKGWQGLQDPDKSTARTKIGPGQTYDPNAGKGDPDFGTF